MPDSSTSSSTFSSILLSDSLVPLGAAFEALEVVDDEEQDIEHLDVHQLVLIKGKYEKELINIKDLQIICRLANTKKLQQSISMLSYLKLKKFNFKSLVSSSLKRILH